MLICDQQPMFSQTHSSIGLLDGSFRNKMSTSSNDNILEKRVRTPILFIHHAAVQSAGDNIDFLYNLLIKSFLNTNIMSRTKDIECYQIVICEMTVKYAMKFWTLIMTRER